MACKGVGDDQLQRDHLTGVVERVTFHSPETGSAVLQVKVRGHRNPVTVVGTLPSVTAGEWRDAHGRWVVSPQYGQQFKAEIIRTSRASPAGRRGTGVPRVPLRLRGAAGAEPPQTEQGFPGFAYGLILAS